MNSHINVIPDRSGVWEWFNASGEKKLVSVVNCEPDPAHKPYLRVYFWGGYYNVCDSEYNSCEWPGPWGDWVCEHGDEGGRELYFMPTPEELEKIIKKKL
jgi:hypothetical protein